MLAVPEVPPTAKHTVVLGQATPFSWLVVEAGAVSAVQLLPPLPVSMISARLPTTPPTAKQVVVLAHATSWSAAVMPVGGLCAAQVEPLEGAAISGLEG